MAGLIALIPLVVALGFQRTSGSTERLAPLDLSGENIVQRPTGWLSVGDAKAEFRANWCRREFINDKECKDLGDREVAFKAEFERRRTAALNDMRRPDWSLRTTRMTNMDFRGAALTNSFLAGANLSGAQMVGSDLFGVQMERANLYKANMESANLRGAQLEGALLMEAQMKGANLSGAQMEDVLLYKAQMVGAMLMEARMEGAKLTGAQMWGAYLSEAQMDGADLRRANMGGVYLTKAQMVGAVFDFSQLIGVAERSDTLIGTNLSMSKNNGGMLRFVDLTGAIFDPSTDFRNSFLDGSVRMTPEFRRQMGEGDENGPCQWAREEIRDDIVFYGRWRGWIEAASLDDSLFLWQRIAPEGFQDVTAIPPPPGCEWKTGPMPGAE